MLFRSLGVVGSYADPFSTYLTLFAGVAEWGAALAALVLLWRRSAGEYFTELQRARTPAAQRAGRPVS